jgi:hypothetical protein
MSLASAAVLILHSNPETAHDLVAAVEKLRGEVVVCAFATEALERLQQYTFSAAVIDASVNAGIVEVELQKRNLPYCKCSEDVAAAVATLTEMLKPGCTN